MNLKKQFRSVIQWEKPQEYEIFRRFTRSGDEIKNASKLILQPGQGCLFTYEGKIRGLFEEEGLYSLKTSNIPFITTILKFMNLFESEHKVGLWFYRIADIVNIRWGTRMPIKYNDPVYGFPVALRGFGNYSIKISEAKNFFTNIVAGQEEYFCDDLQELFISRITQPISNYLANAKFSYAEIDSNIEAIAKDATERTNDIFNDLGFNLLDFRIEGTSFDEDTNKRIAEISDVQAEVKAANIAGIDYAELQKLRALRDAAKNEGTAGAGMGLLAGIEMGKTVSQPQPNQTVQQPENKSTDIRSKLKELKELFDDELISEEEFQFKKKELLDKM